MAKINSKQKGKVGELELAKKLREYGYEARRGQQYCGANGDADVVGVDGLHIECKRTEVGHGKNYQWLKQAIDDARDGEIPVVMHRKNRENWLVTLDFDNFMKIWKNQK